MRLYMWRGEQMTLPNICALEDIAYSTTAGLLKRDGSNLEEAVEKAKAVRTYRAASYEWNGTEYTTLKDLAKDAGLTYKTLRKYMTEGVTIDEAVKTAQEVKADPSKGWRMSVIARKEEKQWRISATDVEKMFFRIMGTSKTKEFGFRRVGENEYVWDGHSLKHKLTVSKIGGEYTARLKRNNAVVCRRVIV